MSLKKRSLVRELQNISAAASQHCGCGALKVQAHAFSAPVKS
jgi:hypothetical protein